MCNHHDEVFTTHHHPEVLKVLELGEVFLQFWVNGLVLHLWVFQKGPELLQSIQLTWGRGKWSHIRTQWWWQNPQPNGHQTLLSIQTLFLLLYYYVLLIISSSIDWAFIVLKSTLNRAHQIIKLTAFFYITSFTQSLWETCLCGLLY